MHEGTVSNAALIPTITWALRGQGDMPLALRLSDGLGHTPKSISMMDALLFILKRKSTQRGEFAPNKRYVDRCEEFGEWQHAHLTFLQRIQTAQAGRHFQEPYTLQALDRRTDRGPVHVR